MPDVFIGTCQGVESVKLFVEGNDKLFVPNDIHFGATDINFGKRQKACVMGSGETTYSLFWLENIADGIATAPDVSVLASAQYFTATSKSVAVRIKKFFSDSIRILAKTGRVMFFPGICERMSSPFCSFSFNIITFIVVSFVDY